jgi:hypothetical protein
VGFSAIGRYNGTTQQPVWRDFLSPPSAIAIAKTEYFTLEHNFPLGFC